MSEDVFKIVAKIMNVPLEMIDKNSSMKTLDNWDSLQHMHLILAVEEEMFIQFTDEDIASIDSVESLLNCIELRQ
jgi:acyl carrier protein